MNPVTSVVLAVFGSLALLLIIGVVQTHRVISILREEHEDLYDSLGRPTLLLNNSVSNSSRLVAFIWSGRVREASDPDLLRCALRLRWIQAAYVVFFATALGLFFLAVSGAR
jgi:hypothetical protein